MRRWPRFVALGTVRRWSSDRRRVRAAGLLPGLAGRTRRQRACGCGQRSSAAGTRGRAEGRSVRGDRSARRRKGVHPRRFRGGLCACGGGAARTARKCQRSSARRCRSLRDRAADRCRGDLASGGRRTTVPRWSRPAARIAGYGTAHGDTWECVGIATGADFPDGLAAGPAIGARGGLLLLTPAESLHDVACGALISNAAAVKSAYIIGGVVV